MSIRTSQKGAVPQISDLNRRLQIAVTGVAPQGYLPVGAPGRATDGEDVLGGRFCLLSDSSEGRRAEEGGSRFDADGV